MKNSIPSEDHQNPNPQSESENDTKFCKSLQDLKDLCSQLHHAADSYQSTFLNSNRKQLVLKNTKEYIHSALVTVVDHLGSVSANLDHHLSTTGSIFETGVKINILNQKLLTCQDYSHKIALAKVSERENYPKYNSRYLKPPVSDILKRKEIDEFKVDDEVPLFLYTCNHYKSSSLLKDTKSILPVRDNLSVQPTSESFHLQGFRKVDPDLCEFANEWFSRGQIHLLKNICTRKQNFTMHLSCEDDEEDEIEMTIEIAKLKQEQKELEKEMLGLNKRIEATERRPKQIMALLCLVAGDPSILPRMMLKTEQKRLVDDAEFAGGVERDGEFG
ncbi:hypothetical protein SSX86_026132 [Deinandra increscens subsp. villosa]|uniref:Uncharacterized protein n=1 Tax=Deinandra increscens subsp. villosa TaxID=3103831 RepID=A0AAP0CJ17_9ASTR